MRRQLFTFCSAVSLLLCAAVCVLWGRAQFARYRVVWAEVARQPGLSRSDWFNTFTYRQSVKFQWDRHTYTGKRQSAFDAGAPTHLRLEQRPPSRLKPRQAPATFWNRLGFMFEHEAEGDDQDSDPENAYERASVAVPYWALALATIALPARWALAAWRRRRPRGEGRCPACGYDLRATPDRCPECGALGSVVGTAG